MNDIIFIILKSDKWQITFQIQEAPRNVSTSIFTILFFYIRDKL